MCFVHMWVYIYACSCGVCISLHEHVQCYVHKSAHDVCMYVHEFMYYKHIHTKLCAYMYIHMLYACININLCTCTCVLYSHVMSIRLCIFVYTWACSCMYVCVCIHTCMRLDIPDDCTLRCSSLVCLVPTAFLCRLLRSCCCNCLSH